MKKKREHGPKNKRECVHTRLNIYILIEFGLRALIYSCAPALKTQTHIQAHSPKITVHGHLLGLTKFRQNYAHRIHIRTYAQTTHKTVCSRFKCFTNYDNTWKIDIPIEKERKYNLRPLNRLIHSIERVASIVILPISRHRLNRKDDIIRWFIMAKVLLTLFIWLMFAISRAISSSISFNWIQ